MKQVVIIGAGHAGTQTAMSLRLNGYPGRIVVLNAEQELPYQRPPMSKAYLRSLVSGAEHSDELIKMYGDHVYEQNNIELISGSVVTDIDRTQREVITASGEVFAYDSLVLATGASPRELPGVSTADERITSYNTPSAAKAVASAASSKKPIAIIGAGFIGLEIASVLAELGAKVTVLEAADRAMNRGMSARTAEFLLERHANLGVEIRTGVRINSIEPTSDAVLITDVQGTAEAFGHVIIGIGVIPNAQLAEKAGLETENGIIVDENLKTSDPHIFAIGDCARFPSAHARNELIRLESLQNANDQARHVAQEISTNELSPYHKVPWFWTEQAGYRVQMVGLVGTDDDFQVQAKQDLADGFSVLCFRDDRCTAVESVNSPKDHVVARRALSDPTHTWTRNKIHVENLFGVRATTSFS